MLSHCLKCRENTEPKIPRVSKTNTGNQCFYPKMLCLIVKNAMGYWVTYN